MNIKESQGYKNMVAEMDIGQLIKDGFLELSPVKGEYKLLKDISSLPHVTIKLKSGYPKQKRDGYIYVSFYSKRTIDPLRKH